MDFSLLHRYHEHGLSNLVKKTSALCLNNPFASHGLFDVIQVSVVCFFIFRAENKNLCSSVSQFNILKKNL